MNILIRLNVEHSNKLIHVIYQEHKVGYHRHSEVNSGKGAAKWSIKKEKKLKEINSMEICFKRDLNHFWNTIRRRNRSIEAYDLEGYGNQQI